MESAVAALPLLLEYRWIGSPTNLPRREKRFVLIVRRLIDRNRNRQEEKGEGQPDL